MSAKEQQVPSTRIRPEAKATPQRRLIPVPDWPKYHAWPPLGGIRYLIFHGATNGFDEVIRRVGKRVLIDEQEFFAWADRQEARK